MHKQVNKQYILYKMQIKPRVFQNLRSMDFLDMSTSPAKPASFPGKMIVRTAGANKERAGLLTITIFVRTMAVRTITSGDVSFPSFKGFS